MRVIIVFSNHERYLPRVRVGDLCILVRSEDEVIKIKFKSICIGFDQNGMPNFKSIESTDEIINKALKINVEIIAHSSKGGKSIQSDATKDYPLQNIALDVLAQWLEHSLLKQNLSRATIALQSCEAADGKSSYPAVAEQIFSLFSIKPGQLTARKGYCYIEKKIYSLNTLEMVVKTAVDQEKLGLETKSTLEKIAFPVLRSFHKFFKYSTEAKVNEKFVYFTGNDNKTYKLDKLANDIFHLMKKTTIESDYTDLKKIIEKNIEDVTSDEFIKLAKYGVKTQSSEKLQLKSSLLLNGSVKKAELINTDLSVYSQKEELLESIVSLKIKLENTIIVNQEALILFLSKVKEFIIYRHPRNYSISIFCSLVKTLDSIVQNNGYLKSGHIEELTEFAKVIASKEQITFDSSYRREAVGLRLPSYYDSIIKATETKNQQFSKVIFDFLEEINQQDVMVPPRYTVNS